ncbi:lipopolysaccharide biosynthesis protein [Rivularia sp. UHCC 0363]|uniref:lipopolysaccharide biosynthesis protein n=1 Tax=Rivularia sp. UHCC 0363 TaxID=3110244 RepID=UPI002B20DD54|nr:oligosaccharide flippase family protein [Rivularia sp. UHCC 0363]MEA5598799.1 oligosaccharide flippase family protein [Rivularia sp. UHCC 0363]
MNRFFKRAKKPGFAGDVLKLISGAAFAQGLTILASPFLTRLYAPEDFGLLALFLSITSIINVIACLRYELAIMLPDSDKEAANLLGVSLCFVILISILTVPIVWLGGPIILDLLKTPQLSAYLWLVPPMVFFNGVFLALNYWNSRTKNFGNLSIARVLQAIGTTGTQLGAGYTSYANGGSLVGASVFGSAVSTLVLGGQIWRDNGAWLKSYINLQGMIAGLKRYYKFPVFGIWSGFMNTVSVQLPTLILASFFSSNVVGYYSLSYRLLGLPMGLIGNAFGQVFYQRAARAKAENTLNLTVEKNFRYLLSLGMLPFLLLTIIGNDIFIVFFGDKWAEAGVYTQILSLWTFFVFIGSPISTLSSILERQEIGFIFNIILLFSRFISLFIGGLIGNVRIGLILFSLTGIVAWIWLTLWLTSQAGVKVKKCFNLLTMNFIYCLPFTLPILFAKWWFNFNHIILMILAIIVCLIYYPLILLQLQNKNLNNLS